MPGPGPVPGEGLDIYDGSSVYWNITLQEEFENEPATLQFKAVNGKVVKINRADGSIFP